MASVGRAFHAVELIDTDREQDAAEDADCDARSERDPTGDASVGTDTLRSIEFIRGSNFVDVYDARGFTTSDPSNPNPSVNSATAWVGPRGVDKI